ncbi:MAG: hypothetical protein WCF76_01180, partial [Pseudolabrys sp.]
FMSAPKLRRRHRIGLIEYFDRGRNRHQNHCRNAQPMSALGQKQTFAVQNGMSAKIKKQTLP